MVYETYTKGNYQVIKINEVLTLSSSITELVDIVHDYLKKNSVNIAIGFTDGSYLFSKSGAVILQCWEAIKEYNGKLALLNVNQDIRDFLAVIDFDSRIKIYNSDDELTFNDNQL